MCECEKSELDELKHFFETEIRISTERLSEPTPFFNGVAVGFGRAKALQKQHIIFCRQMLKMIKKRK